MLLNEDVCQMKRWSDAFLPRHSARAEWLEWWKGWLYVSGAFPLQSAWEGMLSFTRAFPHSPFPT